ncbi:hypothetical protein E4O05_09385 [Treponema sp. OMZ 787]|uniref:hypothetical protein n=1 Tax=Treponema sp. OMZ 787 TaxID=2563669 RepID=UPI0020A4C974|nr:hypothetical protein [Treponema sp. OMZ 787]UTC61753.1 hypothetical protein E4O05_09385 [Treponema sp. OMZ 787]
MKKTIKRFFFYVAFLSLLVSCKNTYNNLLPKNEQQLLKLELENVERNTVGNASGINKKYVIIKVPKGTDVTRLIPQAVVSEQATLFPVTLRYMKEAFPEIDAVKIAEKIALSEEIKSIKELFFDLYSANPKFKVPPLIFPINFLSPVHFAVMGGMGNIEIYTVKVLYEDGTEPGTGVLPPGVPAEKNILRFSVENVQIGESLIKEKTVDFTVKADTEVRALIPQVEVSEGAVPIPVNEYYLQKTAEKMGLDYLNVITGLMTAQNQEAYLKALIAPIDISNFSLPLDKPIDFTNPVSFAILGKDKDVKLYRVTCTRDKNAAELTGFSFSKFNNPGLVKDGIISLNKEDKTIRADVFYPVEYSATEGFSLSCSLEFIGDEAKIEYKGTVYDHKDKMPFVPEKRQGQSDLGSAQAKLTIKFGAETAEYDVFINFKEDPDTVRSITDFRFEKFLNAEIKADSMASISNDGHEGTISATVLYTGAERPESLVPSFISGGKVSLNGIEQSPGSTPQDFRKTLSYLCTSKVGNYTRSYKVKITFIKTENAQAVLKSFKFPSHLNPALSKDAEGKIDELTNAVYLTVNYSQGSEPEYLTPEFSSTGIVTVNGITQSSGFSGHNFKYSVYYKVSAPDDPAVNKTYAVHVNFIFSQDSGCELSAFSIRAADNPTLSRDIEAYISSSNKIYALIPKEADITNIIPSFTARGKVSIGGIEQSSGVSPVNFSDTVEYTVTSENGFYTKVYFVTLQTAGDVIYVNPYAQGRNNGSTWQDAFTSLDLALQKIAELPAGNTAELWLTKNVRVQNKNFETASALIVRGGFEGSEAHHSLRNKENKTLFEDLSLSSIQSLRGTFIFDQINFSSHTQDFEPLAGLNLEEEAETVIEFENCLFNGTRISIDDGRVKMLKLKNIELDEESTLNLKYTSSTPRLNVKIEKAAFKGNLLNEGNFAESIEIADSVFKNHTGLKTLKCLAQNIKAENLTLEGSTLQGGPIQISGENIFTLKDSSLPLTSSIRVKNFNEGSIKIENSLLGSLNLEKEGSEIIKLKNFDLKDSYIGTIETGAGIISEKLAVNGRSVFTGKTGKSLTLPACSLTIKDAFFEGNIDTFCLAKDFRQIMETIPLHTEVDNLTASSLSCGYIEMRKKLLIPPFLELDLRNHYNDSHGYDNEPDDFNQDGTQSITNCNLEQFFIMSGHDINIDGIKLRGKREADIRYEMHRYSRSKKIAQFFIVKNEKTENGTLSIKNIDTECGWLRCISNDVIAENISCPSMSEFYGFERASVQNCNFKNLPYIEYRFHDPAYGGPYRVNSAAVYIMAKEVRFKDNTFENSGYFYQAKNRCVRISVCDKLDISGNKGLSLSLMTKNKIRLENQKFINFFLNSDFIHLHDGCLFSIDFSYNHSQRVDKAIKDMNRPDLNYHAFSKRYEKKDFVSSAHLKNCTFKGAVMIDDLRLSSDQSELPDKKIVFEDCEIDNYIYNQQYDTYLLTQKQHQIRTAIDTEIIRLETEAYISFNIHQGFGKLTIKDSTFGSKVFPNSVKEPFIYSKNLEVTNCTFTLARHVQVIHQGQYHYPSVLRMENCTFKFMGYSSFLKEHDSINSPCINLPQNAQNKISITGCKFEADVPSDSQPKIKKMIKGWQPTGYNGNSDSHGNTYKDITKIFEAPF